MDCRHTVPDWHRYVAPGEDAVPILVACRLLVKEGERASDPRSIACAYWGHQPDCPLYDGPGARMQAEAGRAHPPASQEIPVDPGTVWPVREPGAKDPMRAVMIGLGVVSTALLAWTASVGMAALNGGAAPTGFIRLALAATGISILTHVLATVRAWARR